MSKYIAIVVGDRGGFDAVEPVMKLALQEGYQVALALNATCARQLKDGVLPVDKRVSPLALLPDNSRNTFSSVQRFLNSIKKIDLLLVGASQSEEGTRTAVEMIKDVRVPVLAVQDMYGSLAPTVGRLTSEASRRMTVCVTDKFAWKALSQASTWLYGDPEQIVVTGGPQFDKVVEMRQNWAERRQLLLSAIGVSDETPVFLVVGQLNGTLEAIVTVLHAVSLAGLETDFRIICRTHPRSTKLDRRLLNAACCYDFQHPVNMSDPFSRKMFKRVRREFCDPGPELAKTSEDLLPAVDFVLSGYSTTNLYGILCGMPGVVYLGTPALRGDLYREKKLERPPEVDAGAAWYAETSEELADIVREIRLLIDQPSERLKQMIVNQAKMVAANDGHAAERVWAEAKKLLS